MSVFVYLILILIIFIVELNRKKYFTYDFMISFNFFFLISYALTPLILASAEDPSVYFANDLTKGVYYYGDGKTPFLILFSYLIFLAGYYNSYFRKTLPVFIIKPKFQESSFIKISPFLVAILLFFMVVYVMQFGGVRETIMAAEAYRSDEYEPPKFGFVQRFFPANIVLLYYSFFKAFLDEENEKYKTPYIILFLFSFAYFLFVFVLYNSRGYLITTLGGLYIIMSMVKRRYYFVQVLLLSIIAVAVIEIGDPLFYAIPELIDNGWESFVTAFLDLVKEGEREGGFALFISNFTHPIISLDLSLKVAGSEEVPFRYFSDFVIAVLSLLPDKLVGFKDPLSVSNINTILNIGELKGTVLVGILGFFAYSLGVAGIVIGMFFYGVLGGYLSKFFYENYKENKTVIVFAYFFIFYYGYFVFRGDPKITLGEVFILIFIIGVILLFSDIYVKKSFDDIKYSKPFSNRNEYEVK